MPRWEVEDAASSGSDAALVLPAFRQLPTYWRPHRLADAGLASRHGLTLDELGAPIRCRGDALAALQADRATAGAAERLTLAMPL